MIEIIKRGNNDIYKIICDVCKCEFLFQEIDVNYEFKRISFDESERHYYIRCPDCAKRIWLGTSLIDYKVNNTVNKRKTMNDKTLADLGVSIKEIYLNRIVDRTTGEVIQEFKPPYLWWREGDSVFDPYEEVKLTKNQMSPREDTI